jgi:hypothetical protein
MGFANVPFPPSLIVSLKETNNPNSMDNANGTITNNIFKSWNMKKYNIAPNINMRERRDIALIDNKKMGFPDKLKTTI